MHALFTPITSSPCAPVAPPPLSSGVHTLRVAANERVIPFEGRILDEDGTSPAPAANEERIELRGDAVTNVTDGPQSGDRFGEGNRRCGAICEVKPFGGNSR